MIRIDELDPMFQRLTDFGHLRPGTYDILSRRYDQMPDFGIGHAPVIAEPARVPFTLPDVKREQIDALLVEEGFTELNTESLLAYVRDGTVGTVCIYEASSEDKIREHAQRADLPVGRELPNGSGRAQVRRLQRYRMWPRSGIGNLGLGNRAGWIYRPAADRDSSICRRRNGKWKSHRGAQVDSGNRSRPLQCADR